MLLRPKAVVIIALLMFTGCSPADADRPPPASEPAAEGARRTGLTRTEGRLQGTRRQASDREAREAARPRVGRQPPQPRTAKRWL